MSRNSKAKLFRIATELWLGMSPEAFDAIHIIGDPAQESLEESRRVKLDRQVLVDWTNLFDHWKTC